MYNNDNGSSCEGVNNIQVELKTKQIFKSEKNKEIITLFGARTLLTIELVCCLFSQS